MNRTLLLSFCFFCSFSSNLGAGTLSQRDHDYSEVTALRLRGLDVELRLQTANVAGVRVKLSGSEQRLDQLRLERQNGTLTISDEGGGQSRTIVSGSNTVIVSGPGASASVTINGQTQRPAPQVARPQLTIEMAPAVTLRVDDFIGRGEIAALRSAAVIGVTGGSLTLAAGRDLELAVTGSGSLRVASAGGDLTARLTGSGELHVEQAELDEVTIALQGSGSVHIDGSAASARLNLTGSGDITLGEVRTAPQTRLLGSGEIRVGGRLIAQ